MTTSSRCPARSWPRWAESDEIVALVVRPVEEYAAAHIPGALSVPVGELATRLTERPAEVEVVAYCRGAYCVLRTRRSGCCARRAVRPASSSTGCSKWQLAGLPLASGAA